MDRENRINRKMNIEAYGIRLLSSSPVQNGKRYYKCLGCNETAVETDNGITYRMQSYHPYCSRLLHMENVDRIVQRIFYNHEKERLSEDTYNEFPELLQAYGWRHGDQMEEYLLKVNIKPLKLARND